MKRLTILGSIRKATVVTRRVRLFGCLAGSHFVIFPGTPARSTVVFTVLAAVMLPAGGFFLGYRVLAPNPATVQVHAESLVNLPAPISNMAARSSQPSWGADFLGRSMTYYQQYTCGKFGPACRIALAIQAAENLKGDCQAYNYNSNGTLDWGYFQINSVHLTRRGVNLRDLLDCKANIDFAYELYREEGFQPWSTFVSGQYRKFLDDSLPNGMADPRLRRSPERFLLSDVF